MQTFSVSSTPGRVTARGEIDLTSAEAFGQALADAVAAGPRELRIDLSAVTFMDSSGLNELVRANRGDLQLVVVGASDAVTRVIRLVGLDSVIELA
jgi:anti-sigma B factor antagonist